MKRAAVILLLAGCSSVPQPPATSVASSESESASQVTIVSSPAALPTADVGDLVVTAPTPTPAPTSTQPTVSATPTQPAPTPLPLSIISKLAAAGITQPKNFQTSDQLLDALGQATNGLRDFQASVIYDRLDAITEDRERRVGRIVFEQSETATRRFAIAFDQFIDAAGHASPQSQRFTFADGWLVEFDDTRHQCIERQLVPPGRNLDPLRLGEGPMPLPIGQNSDDVRRRFGVSLAPPPEVPLLKKLQNVQGLLLIPRKGSGIEEDFEQVCVWYDLHTLAPVGVVARLKGGDTKTVLLRDVVVNGGLDETSKSMLRTTVPEGWQRDVRPWKKPEA